MPRGFTIIETVMVMVIVAILSVVLLLRWGASDKARLDSSVRKIVSDIRYAQKLSVSSQTRAGIIFYPDSYEVYAVINSTPPTLANSPGEPCSTDSSGKFVVNFTQGRCKEFEGVTLSYITNTISFDSIGGLVNSTGEDITVNYKGSKTLSIENSTGRVSY
ncbi:MAG: type II secretion system protein [Nitrospirae bacterium]|nr:type II secretion system protein [Nitrospirota bacterium]